MLRTPSGQDIMGKEKRSVTFRYPQSTHLFTSEGCRSATSEGPLIKGCLKFKGDSAGGIASTWCGVLSSVEDKESTETFSSGRKVAVTNGEKNLPETH